MSEREELVKRLRSRAESQRKHAEGWNKRLALTEGLNAEILAKALDEAADYIAALSAQPQPKPTSDKLEKIIADFCENFECDGADGEDEPVTDEQRKFARGVIDGLLADPAWDELWGRQIEEMVQQRMAAQPQQEPVAHSDDAAVDRFAAAMKAKMAKKRAEGRGGWDDPEQCTIDYLTRLFHDHVRKGDPVDIGNFAMMLWHRISATSLPAQYRRIPAAPQPDGVVVPRNIIYGDTLPVGRQSVSIMFISPADRDRWLAAAKEQK